MSDTQLHYLTLVEVSNLLRRREISSVELTSGLLRRIVQLEPGLGSYATVTAEQALDQAREADVELARGEPRSVLHGVPVAVKDLCFTKGIRTAMGTTVYRDWRPEFDATVVTRLRAAGEVLLGKLQMTESATLQHHPAIRAPSNPWSADHWPGVSSSGSGVATAAGLCFGSLGSDTAGSIRFPSAANGVVGIKPTWGRVSRHGIFPLSETYDHVGPMARSVADAAAILSVIAGHDPSDPTSSREPVPDYCSKPDVELSGVKVGIDRRFNSNGVDPEVTEALAAAEGLLGGLGAEHIDVRFPDSELLVGNWRPHAALEAAIAHRDTYPARRDEYGDGLKRLLDLAPKVTGIELAQYLLARAAFAGRLRGLFEQVDVLLVPAQVFAGPSIARMATVWPDLASVLALFRFTVPFNMTGVPAITLPCGFTSAGIPMALQFVSRHWREDLLCRVGHVYEQAARWHRRHPEL